MLRKYVKYVARKLYWDVRYGIIVIIECAFTRSTASVSFFQRPVKS